MRASRLQSSMLARSMLLRSCARNGSGGAGTCMLALQCCGEVECLVDAAKFPLRDALVPIVRAELCAWAVLQTVPPKDVINV